MYKDEEKKIHSLLPSNPTLYHSALFSSDYSEIKLVLMLPDGTLGSIMIQTGLRHLPSPPNQTSYLGIMDLIPVTVFLGFAVAVLAKALTPDDVFPGLAVVMLPKLNLGFLSAGFSI